MKISLRIFLFGLLTWCLVSQLYIVALPLYLWYLLRYQGYELLILAILVDGYFQSFNTLPFLSLITILLFFFLDIIKPQLLMYTSKNEVV